MLGIDPQEVGILGGVGVVAVAVLKYIPTILAIWKAVSKYIKPVVEKIEELSADGKIDAKDRMEIAKVSVEQTAIGMGFKIGFVEKKVISILINKGVKMLPPTGLKRKIQPSIEEVVKIVEIKGNGNKKPVRRRATR